MMNFSEVCNNLHIPDVVGPSEVQFKTITKKSFNAKHTYTPQDKNLFGYKYFQKIVYNLKFKVYASIGHWNTSVLVILALHLLPVWGVSITLLWR